MPTEKRTPVWPVAALIAVITAGTAVLLILLLTGGDEPKPKPVPTPQRAASLTESNVTSLLHRYEAAYSSEDVDQLAALFAPGFRRTNGDDPPESRDEALATYASQFEELEAPVYELHDVMVTVTGDTARAEGNYGITSSAGTATGSISFDIAAVDGKPLITAIVTGPNDGTTIPSPQPKPKPKPDKPGGGGSGSYASTCSVKAWYSGPPLTVNSFIHFKCVDEDSGETVTEAEGSDEIDLEDEADAVERNAAREALVDQLSSKLEADGWTEIGTVEGGEWYELRFGR